MTTREFEIQDDARFLLVRCEVYGPEVEAHEPSESRDGHGGREVVGWNFDVDDVREIDSDGAETRLDFEGRDLVWLRARIVEKLLAELPTRVVPARIDDEWAAAIEKAERDAAVESSFQALDRRRHDGETTE